MQLVLHCFCFKFIQQHIRIQWDPRIPTENVKCKKSMSANTTILLTDRVHLFFKQILILLWYTYMLSPWRGITHTLVSLLWYLYINDFQLKVSKLHSNWFKTMWSFQVDKCFIIEWLLKSQHVDKQVYLSSVYINDSLFHIHGFLVKSVS